MADRVGRLAKSIFAWCKKSQWLESIWNRHSSAWIE